jgi:hypothetical protein
VGNYGALMKRSLLVFWSVVGLGAATGWTVSRALDARMQSGDAPISLFAPFATASASAAFAVDRAVSSFAKTREIKPRAVNAVSEIAKTRAAPRANQPATAQQPLALAANIPVTQASLQAPLQASLPIVAPARQSMTQLVAFNNSPFPYFRKASQAQNRFSHVGGTYSDPRVLLHIPRQFDIEKPGVMILFFHGHGATLQRDVLERQQTAAQISASGINAVLAAPQFAVDAADSSAGKLGEPGGLERFLQEAADQFAMLYNDPRAIDAFAQMPVVIVAYSGGYLPAALSLHRGGASERIRGVVLLDGLYGQLDKFESWITHNRSGFFVSAYTGSTRGRNAELKQSLAGRHIDFSASMPQVLRPGSVAFLSVGGDIRHRDFVTNAWTRQPIQDLLEKLKDYPL